MPASPPALRVFSAIPTALGCFVLAMSACSSTTPEANRARPSPDATAASHARDAQGANPTHGEPSPWSLLQELPSLRRATAREHSQHLTGDLHSEALANELAEPYPNLGPGQELPAGAVVVASHYRPGNGEPVVFFVMIKQRPGFHPEGGNWEYLVVRPTGELEQRGRLPLCGRCHAEAPRDHLFGRAP